MALNFSAFTGQSKTTKTPVAGSKFPKLSSFLTGGGTDSQVGRTALSTPSVLNRSKVDSAIKNVRKSMEFRVTTKPQQENIHRSARLGQLPLTEIKFPFVQEGTIRPSTFTRDSAKLIIELPEKIKKSIEQIPSIFSTGGEIKSKTGKVWNVSTYQEDSEEINKEIIDGNLPLAYGALPFIQVPLDISLVGDIISKAARGLGKETISNTAREAAWDLLGKQKTLKLANKSKRKLLATFHPDGPTGNIEMFKNVSDAYDILKKEGIPTTSFLDPIRNQISKLNKPISEILPSEIVSTTRFADVRGELPGFRRRPGQAPALGLSLEELEPVGGRAKQTALQVAKKAKDSRALSAIVKNIDTVDRDIMKGFVDAVQAGKTPAKEVAFRAQGLADAMKLRESTSGNKALANKFGEILDADRGALKKKFDIKVGEKESLTTNASKFATVEEFIESQFPPVVRTGKTAIFAKKFDHFEDFGEAVVKEFPESDIITKTGNRGIDFTKTDIKDKLLIELEGDSIEDIFFILKNDFNINRPLPKVKELEDIFNKAKKPLPTELAETPSIKDFNRFEKEAPEITFKNTDDMKLLRSKETGDVVAVRNRAGETKRLDTPQHKRQRIQKRAEVIKSKRQPQKQTPQKERQKQKVSDTRVSRKDPSVVPDIPKVSEDSLLSSIAQENVHVISGTPEKKIIAHESQRDSINNILNVTEMSIKPTKKVGDLTKRDLVKEVQDTIKRQGDKLKDSEITKIREENLLGAETIDEIILRKRGIITDKEAIERAKVMAGTIEDVLNIPKGSVPTKEQLTAVSQIIQQEREINKKLIQLADGFGSASSKEEKELVKNLGRDFEKLTEGEIINRALEESTLKLRKGEIVLFSLKSEIGRSLQGTKQVVDAVDSRMRIMYGKIRKLDELEQQSTIEQLSKIHLDNDKEFIKFLDQYNSADLFDKFAEWATAAKLWNPTTHIVNFAGNTLRQVFDVGVTSIVSPMTIKADIMGSIVGLDKGIKNALRAMTDEGYASQLSKYIEEGGTAPAIKGKLGTFVRTPFRALGASDEIFRAIGYQRSLYRQASKLAKGDAKEMQKILQRPTIKMMEDATFQSKRLTFQEDMGELVRKINEARTPANFKSKVAKSASLLLRLNVSFLKTPTNLAKQALDLSPVGLIKNFPEIKKLTQKGDSEHAKRLLAEAIFGTALAVWTIQQAQDGNMTGGAPRNKSDKDKFYRENKLPYAIKFDDTWYQYKRVDPFSTILATVSDLVELKNEENLDVGGVIQSLSNQMEDKTYMRGFSDLMKFMTGEQWERDYVWKSMVLGATLPSFIGHTARSIDPNIREAKTITDRIKTQIPFVSTSLPMRVNALGEPIERANKGFNYFFNPIQSAVAEISPITKHLMDIDKTIPVPQSFFKRNGVRYDLPPDVYEDYSKQLGKELVNEIEKLMRSSSYMRKSNEEKSEKIEKIRKKIAKDWKDDYLKKQKAPISRDELKELLREKLNSGDISREDVVSKLKNYDKRF